MPDPLPTPKEDQGFLNPRKHEKKKILAARKMEIAHAAKKRKAHESIFPHGVCCLQTLLEIEDVFFVDKTGQIRELEAMGNAVLLLAPPQFGKTTFLDTLACYYDQSLATGFASLFSNLDIASNPTSLASRCMVLRLDLNRLSTASSFIGSLYSLVKRSISSFWAKYAVKKELPPHRIAQCAEMAVSSNSHLVILIDNYDAMLHGTLVRITENPKCATQLADLFNEYEALFAEIQMCIDKGSTRLFATGTHPISLRSVPSSFWSFASDILPQIFGFSHLDVERGVSKLKLSTGTYKEEFLSALTRLEGPGHRFSRKSLTKMMSPGRILYLLKQTSIYLSVSPEHQDEKAILSIQANLTKMPICRGPISICSSHASLPWVIRETLYSTTGCFSLTTDSFQLDEMLRVSKWPKVTLLSYLYFSGVLTHELVPDSQHPFRLTYSTNFIQNELVNVLREPMHGELANLNAAVNGLLFEHSSLPLLRVLQHQLRYSSEIFDSLNMENETRVATYSALLLCRRTSDDVFTEPKPVTDTNLSIKNLYGFEDHVVVYRAWLEMMDLPTVPKRIVFDFRAIPAARVHFNPKPRRLEPTIDEISILLLELPESEILDLSFQASHSDAPTTIRSFLTTALEELNVIIASMNLDSEAEGVARGIVIVRVGAYRLLTIALDTPSSPQLVSKQS